MSSDAPRLEGEVDPTFTGAGGGLPLWEVFVRAARGLNHVHAGSVHAADAESAIQSARDVYTRRNEGVSIWVVPSREIHAADPPAHDASLHTDPPPPHPPHSHLPEEVAHM